MFLTDPALRRIAAATNDVLAEHLWRYDTAAADPLGDLARILHRTTLGFNKTTAFLDKALARLGELSETAQQQLAARAELGPAGYGQALADVWTASERHSVLGCLLIDAYRSWRTYRAIDNGDERRLLVQPGDPARGVTVLRRHGPDTWLAFPDAEAALAFEIPYPQRIVGEITQTDCGWIPTAYTNPAQLQTQPAIVYPLPACDDLASACRSLLRWWHLRHSAAWRNRTPDQLTEPERAQLAA